MSLYHKYRPNNLKQVVGNKSVVEYFENLDKETAPQTYLFHGGTGCGKTTLARIVGSLVGGEGNDVREINSANFRGIDTVRELIRSCRLHPQFGEANVYIIDEAHKLTNDAQNAFLKLLEDPPTFTYFILCTTQPKKLIKEVVGRCVQFEMKKLSEPEMKTLLRRVAKKEELKLNSSVYEAIIDAAEGHPRNALQYLEKIIGLSPDEVVASIEAIKDEEAQSIDLCRLLFQNTGWKPIANVLKALKDSEPEGIRRHVLGYAQSVLLNKENDKAAFVIEEFSEPFYNTGFAGLVLACYSVNKG